MNAGSLLVMFNLKTNSKRNENDTDGAVDFFFVVLYVNYGCFK
jgi:hypothetical protein